MRKQIYVAATLWLSTLISHAEGWNGHFKQLIQEEKMPAMSRSLRSDAEKTVIAQQPNQTGLMDTNFPQSQFMTAVVMCR
jgi:hypothetical protein